MSGPFDFLIEYPWSIPSLESQETITAQPAPPQCGVGGDRGCTPVTTHYYCTLGNQRAHVKPAIRTHSHRRVLLYGIMGHQAMYHYQQIFTINPSFNSPSLEEPNRINWWSVAATEVECSIGPLYLKDLATTMSQDIYLCTSTYFPWCSLVF